MHFAPYCLSRLVANSWFLKPNNPLLTPKNLLFNGYFALFSHVFHGSKRFCLYNWCGCLCFLSRILRQIAPHFAAFHLAFSTKTHCILQQIARKWVQMAALWNKYTFFRMHRLPSFCIKTSLRENRFFAARWAVGE